MSGEKSSGWLSSGVKPIVDITVAVTAVVAYLQAIFKLIETDFPNTVSLLTIVFTSVMVVGWRWGRLNEKKKKTLRTGGSKTPSSGSLTERILEPFTTSSRDNYALSLTRRRAEGGVIAVLVVFTLGWTGVNVSDVYVEMLNDPALTCSYTTGANNLLIYVADVPETDDSQESQISNRIYDALVKNQEGNQFNVCRLKETFEVSTDALVKAQADEVDIIIWIRKDAVFEIHLETPLFSDPDRVIYQADSPVAESREFLVKEPSNIAYVTEFALTEVLVLKDRMPEAQIRLRDAINRAEQQAVKDPRLALPPRDLAEGHYLLGLFYSPHFSFYPDEEKAIEEYSTAIDIDKSLHKAWLNRGFLLMAMDRNDEAKVDFDFLIENNTPYKGMACVNRAGLQTDPDARMSDLDCAVQFDPQDGYFFRGIEHMDRGEYQDAINDFEKAVEYDPTGYENYLYLGLVQLNAGEYEAAKETFRVIPRYLEEETREEVVDKLLKNAQIHPEIKRTTDEIIRALQAAKLP
jgi:tetratricopeptide (TPR) repeat protein/type III secretory pathway component EscS